MVSRNGRKNLTNDLGTLLLPDRPWKIRNFNVDLHHTNSLTVYGSKTSSGVGSAATVQDNSHAQNLGSYNILGVDLFAIL